MCKAVFLILLIKNFPIIHLVG
uniref:Uncharacterized protein n=1 Tax=Rhizophora mucronata TaxID=61149 RepID=A0A2P2PVE7_RHIMU